MRKYFIWAGTIAIAGTLSLSASSVVRIVLDDSSATASSSHGMRDAKYAVNGAGLTGDQHTAAAADYVAWMSPSLPTVSNQWFRIDLGDVLPLDHLKLWNFNWNHATVDTEGRGVKDVEFYVSSAPTAPPPDFTNAVLWTLVTNATFAKAPGVDTYTGEPDVNLHGI